MTLILSKSLTYTYIHDVQLAAQFYGAVVGCRHCSILLIMDLSKLMISVLRCKDVKQK